MNKSVTAGDIFEKIFIIYIRMILIKKFVKLHESAINRNGENTKLKIM